LIEVKMKLILCLFLGVSVVSMIGCKQKDFDTKKLGITWCLVPAGEFQMGSIEEQSRYENELPLHSVFLDEFFISSTEITWDQYSIFCEETRKEKPKGLPEYSGKYPVTHISWKDAIDFCEWLSKKTGCSISLPTEAQWEKACRGGTLGDTYLYKNRELWSDSKDDPLNLLSSTAWIVYNSKGKIHPVGQLKPNPFGIYDMLGNVYEWCWDAYGDDYYKYSPKENPTGPITRSENSSIVIRGGAYDTELNDIRCAYRSHTSPSKAEDIGFRIVKNH